MGELGGGGVHGAFWAVGGWEMHVGSWDESAGGWQGASICLRVG